MLNNSRLRNNTANILTMTRVVLLPLIIPTFYWSIWDIFTMRCIAFVLMMIAECTDMLDGHIARKLKQESNLGKLLDPLADSIYRSSMFIVFVGLGYMPFWFLYVLVPRDITVAYVRTLCSLRGEVVSARKSGVIKAFFQGGAMLGVMILDLIRFWPGAESTSTIFDTLILLLFAAAALYTLYSWYDYLVGSSKTWVKLIPH